MDSSGPGFFLVCEAETVFCLSITFLHNPFFGSSFLFVCRNKEGFFPPLITGKELD